MSSSQLSKAFSYLLGLARPRRWQTAAWPMCGPLAFLLTGIVPVVLWEFEGIAIWQVTAMTGLSLAVSLWAFAVHWRVALVCTVIGFSLAIFHVNRPWNTYRKIIPPQGSFIEAEIVVTDTGLLGRKDLEWLNPSKRVWASVRRIRVNRDSPWVACRGRLQVYVEDTQGMTHGDRFRVTGALRNPIANTLSHGFDQKRYLKLKGVEHSLHVIDRKPLPRSTWRLPMRWLLAARGCVLARLLNGIDDVRCQGILAGVVFGMKNGVDRECKRRFLLSGMIHLLAVSGLHVGILATIIMWAMKLARVQYRVRYAVLPLLLLGFVLMTGAGVSAVRAWLMIAIWASGKSMMKPSVPLNAVFAAAFILLLVNPVSIMTIGFQFSFLLVTAILAGWRLLGMLWACLGVRSILVPGRAQKKFRRWSAVRKSAFMTIGAMSIFWLAGLGLSVHFNRFINPVGIIGNVCVTVVAWALMVASWLKIPLELLYIPVLPDLLGSVLTFLVGSLERVAELASTDSTIFGIGALPRWWFPAYHISIMVLVSSPPRVSGIVLRLCVPILLIWMALASSVDDRCSIDVFAVSGSDAPVVCIRDGGKCTLVNVGTRGFDYYLVPWLEAQGIRRIDNVVLLEGRVKHCGSLKGLVEKVTVPRIDIIAGRRPRKSWMSYLIRRGVDVRYGHVKGAMESHCSPTKGTPVMTVITIRTGRGRVIRLEFKKGLHGNGLLTVDAGIFKTFPLWYHRDNKWIASFDLE